MGSRARQDPVGHQHRGKGHPTPARPDEPALEAHEPQGPPVMARTVAIVEGVMASGSAAPNGEAMLDLYFAAGTAQVVTRIPLDKWEQVRDTIDEGVSNIRAQAGTDETSERAAAAGIHMPAGVDLDKEAAAHQDLRGEQQ